MSKTSIEGGKLRVAVENTVGKSMGPGSRQDDNWNVLWQS